jgi:putative flippase GtrA
MRTAGRRFARFNTVSAGGFVVQIVTVAMLTRWLGQSDVPATALAVGAAIVHNFAWHCRWTWADRYRDTGTRRRLLATFVRYAAANGLVSIAGGVLIVAVLALEIGLHVVISNIVAVAVCGLVNYQIGDRVVFRPGRDTAAGWSRRIAASSVVRHDATAPVRYPAGESPQSRAPSPRPEASAG